jgi:spore germination cell wall hydrolase CwlJ-like protein
MCLALVIYHEARSEPEVAQRAVAHVVLNRTRDPRWPSQVCEVVRDQTQFQFKMVEPMEKQAWSKALKIASNVLSNKDKDPTNGALWFHGKHQKKIWSMRLEAINLPGYHVFWREQ